MTKNEKVQQFINLANDYIHENNYTEKQLDKVIQDLFHIPMYSDFSKEEISFIQDKLRDRLSISYSDSFVVTGSSQHEPWFEEAYGKINDVTRWDRYIKYLRKCKNFSPSVIQDMRKNLFKIIDLLGDPTGNNFRRKGLVVGDVQSGKTANYIGLMNLAADMKYKIIIVLTGTTNTLREQTQQRIYEGMGKANSKDGVNSININSYSKDQHPVYLTSIEQDFNKNTSTGFQTSVGSTTAPIIIVTKKNTSSLKNIKSWLDDYSKDINKDYIDYSLLLIDDEADFASVNTKDEAEGESPTIINRRIREILELFTKSSYIGFTATPFANVFINPNTEDEMFGQDLFPKDYIYVLGQPSNYIGIHSIFSDSYDDEEENYSDMIEIIDENEMELFLPLKHKKETRFDKIPPVLQEAINLFFIGNVIRDFREDNSKHRTMMINISRFQNVHQRIKDAVIERVTEMIKEIRMYANLPLKEALSYETLKSLRDSYYAYYDSLKESYDFNDILTNMYKSVKNIEVYIANANNKDLDYANSKEGVRAIVIGGFSLSRGITLEGLMISFYYRNSVMYDSLLQMGRWFGYRENYADLCKIFMTEKVVEDFKFISLATEELKEDLEMNLKKNLTPLDFGIRVRSGQAGLMVTARNKMKASDSITAKVNYNNEIISMRKFSLNKEMNLSNKRLINSFVEKHIDKLSDDLLYTRDDSIGLRDIDKLEIIDLISEFKSLPSSLFDSKLIIDWLRGNNHKSLQKWDVAFALVKDGRNNGKEISFSGNIQGNSRTLAVHVMDEVKQIYRLNKSRLGNPDDGKYGLSREQIDKISTHFGDKNAQKKYLWSELNRKPLLMVYAISPKVHQTNTLIDTDPILLLSLSIPDLGIGQSKSIEYIVNNVYQDIESLETEGDE